ncbi:hypothetical protein BELL_2185g00010 [Botrytis elliptica]|uniref:Uncharacterized protein n=1 Tax=Botrytis elliptica TaxID=278938 RepID=A0A4Z1HIG0_9HELO|nr:hypothetical protein BELL_2185g00010 [Botrytis elliptica]
MKDIKELTRGTYELMEEMRDLARESRNLCLETRDLARFQTQITAGQLSLAMSDKVEERTGKTQHTTEELESYIDALREEIRRRSGA